MLSLGRRRVRKRVDGGAAKVGQKAVEERGRWGKAWRHRNRQQVTRGFMTKVKGGAEGRREIASDLVSPMNVCPSRNSRSPWILSEARESNESSPSNP